MREVTLALDLGTRTGWALSHDGRVSFGTADFSKFANPDKEGLRFLRFRQFLTETKNRVGSIDRVIFESVNARHTSKQAALVYFGFRAMVTSWCQHHGIAYEGVSVGAIKKHATGKGNADKDAMIQVAKKRGYNVTDDNQADAIALLICVAETKA